MITKIRNVNIDNQILLEIMGFDSQKNSFSSLNGVRFSWKLSDTSVMSFVKIKDTHLLGDPNRQ